MRTKHFLIVLCCVVLTSALLILFSPAGQQTGPFKSIVSQTHHHIREFHENMVSPRKKLDIDKKYLDLLGFTQPIYNGTKHNFTIVTYIQAGQVASAIALSQNIAERMPNAVLLVYTLATLSDDEWHDLNGSCNNSKCLVIVYDLRPFPAYVANDEYMHAYRPLIVMDALSRSRTILLLANTIRLQRGTADAFEQMVRHTNGKMCGILGLTTRLQAVSTRTHPKMFDYFETTAENFLFLPMVSMDMVIFSDSQSLRDSVMLPWIRCTLTMECIHPIGAQSGGCRYNKKPQYRYSGCHAFDASAFNIVLGLQWNFDVNKYSVNSNSTLFYQQTLEEATKNVEHKKKNISEIPFTDDN